MANGQDPPSSTGWLYAMGLSLTSFAMLFHHILYYLGYRMGIQQRIQLTAAVHSKLQRLNSASITSISAGMETITASPPVSDDLTFDRGSHLQDLS